MCQNKKLTDIVAQKMLALLPGFINQVESPHMNRTLHISRAFKEMEKPNIGKVISCIICICMCSNPIGQFIYGIIFEHIGKIKAKPAEPGVV